MSNVSTVTYDVFSDENLNSFYFYETEQLTVLWILFVVTVTGNGGVLLAVLHSNRKSRMNYFIKHLAFTDLLVGLVNILTDIIWKMTIVWYAGNVACKAIRYFQAVITYSSTYVLVALSLDRYDAIKHPMKFSGSWQKARWLIISAWTLSAIFSLPMLFFYEEKHIQGKLQCWIDFPHHWQWKLYMSLVSTALFIIPTIIIATCYTVIVHVIRSKTIIQVSKKYEIRTDGGRWKKTVSRGLIPRAKVKTVKVTVVIVSVFIICWSPFIIFDLLQVYGFVPQTQQNIAIATFMQSLAPLNSAANPIIYCVFSTNVFKSLCKLLRRCRPMSRKESPNPTNTQSSSLTEFLTKTDTQQKRKNTLVQYKNRRTEVHL